MPPLPRGWTSRYAKRAGFAICRQLGRVRQSDFISCVVELQDALHEQGRELTPDQIMVLIGDEGWLCSMACGWLQVRKGM
jgi:hypothetical protein